jgi:hypothetical protein
MYIATLAIVNKICYCQTMIASIDPGLHDSGLALWTDDGELTWAVLVSTPRHLRGIDAWWTMARDIRERLISVTEITIELPQVYVRSRSKGDPNDLIQLAAVVGALAGTLLGKITIYKPAEWKGQATKEVTKNRCLEKLRPDETARIVLPAKSLQHNVWDAIGLGLHHLKITRPALQERPKPTSCSPARP